MMESWLLLHQNALNKGADVWVTRKTLEKANVTIPSKIAVDILRASHNCEPLGPPGTREYFQVRLKRKSAEQIKIEDLEARLEKLEKILLTQ